MKKKLVSIISVGLLIYAISLNAQSKSKEDSKPQRVTFASGKSEADESISLKAGESKKFVVNAKTGQIFMATSDSKDLEIKMLKGKDTAQMKEPGHYDSTLLANGDYIFQVKNTSKKEVKTSVKIIIDHTSASKP
jgi:hypothetical protein